MRRRHPTHREGPLPTTPRLLLFVVSLAGPLALHAQAAQGTVPSVGAVVRITLAQQMAAPRPQSRPADATRPTGRVVAADSAQFSVRLADGWVQAYPASAIQRMDVRTGPGLCRGGIGRRVACTAVGLATGALVGSAVFLATVPKADDLFPGPSDVFGPSASDAALERRRRTRRNGALIGGVMGAGVGVSIGLDRWKRIR